MSCVRFVVLSGLLLSLSACFADFGPSHATRAIELRKEGKYDEAIEEYRIHRREREKSKYRPADENPAFYELLIGDVYLEAGKPLEAEAAYERALQEKVSDELVNYKLRGLAQWYESKNRIQEALTVLNKYREREPVLFDFDIDRLHKRALREEDERSGENP